MKDLKMCKKLQAGVYRVFIKLHSYICTIDNNNQNSHNESAIMTPNEPEPAKMSSHRFQISLSELYANNIIARVNI